MRISVFCNEKKKIAMSCVGNGFDVSRIEKSIFNLVSDELFVSLK